MNCELVLLERPLGVVQTFNYLGVLLDTHMSLSPQLKKLIRVKQVRLAQLRRIRTNSDEATSLLVYKQMVRPISEYGGFLVDGGPVWAVNKLQTIQNNGLRICERIFDAREVPVLALHQRNKMAYLSVSRNNQLLIIV